MTSADDHVATVVARLVADDLVPPIAGIVDEGRDEPDLVISVTADLDDELMSRIARAVGGLRYQVRKVAPGDGMLAVGEGN